VGYDGMYPLSPSIILGYRPLFLKAQYCAPPCQQNLPLNPPIKLDYCQLLSPALFGAAGALFLSLFADRNHLTERSGGTLFKLAIVSYAIGASVAAAIGVTDVLENSKAPHDHLLYPIGGAIVSIILLFAAEYLLLYRFFSSSFKGDVGDNFWTRFLSFLYYSVTVLPGTPGGDIMPENFTARALIATEIAFYLFTIATAIQLLLAQAN
jgi:hypothetical protein